ncbi:dihydrodipicolinate synthase family protein [Paraburkholderia sp. BL25I1N1]|uniref:dihydrodipicolinate synthase family protein n=1 Tax=Paraburkholderia sp. BL25I1N1 TaxID=1938804 RepID=UPI000D488C98|nr:dihydrodipicolinate synthase family protein [Paraburkholderia sp. BL25I1N1]PRY07053.1 hypothetical protein B0G73_105195 [Paraburkholderia sp. BL25I1N1]
MAKLEVTESMITEAMDTGSQRGLLVQGVKRTDVAELLRRTLALAGSRDGSQWNCRVVYRGNPERGRLVGPSTEQRGYFYVEVENGPRLHVHGNEIYPNSTYKASRS